MRAQTILGLNFAPLAYDNLRKVKNKREFQAFSPERGCCRLREVFAKRFQIK